MTTLTRLLETKVTRPRRVFKYHKGSSLQDVSVTLKPIMSDCYDGMGNATDEAYKARAALVRKGNGCGLSKPEKKLLSELNTLIHGE